TQIGEVGPRTLPDLRVESDIVLPVGRRNLPAAHFREVGDRRLLPATSSSRQQQGPGNFRERVHGFSAPLRDNFSQSRWYTKEIASSSAPRTMKLSIR